MNRIRKEKTAKSQKKGKGLVSRTVNALLSGEFLTREGVIKHLPFLLFLAFLFMLNISWIYFSENTVRDLAKTKKHLQELQSEYNSVSSELVRKKRQSEVAADIEQLGLKESTRPAERLEVSPDFFDEE